MESSVIVVVDAWFTIIICVVSSVSPHGCLAGCFVKLN